MDADETAAARLLARAVEEEQVAIRLDPGAEVDELRAEIRRLARRARVRVRTAVMDGVLVVVRADAAVWHESAAVMRAKLTPSADSSDPGVLDPSGRRGSGGRGRL